MPATPTIDADGLVTRLEAKSPGFAAGAPVSLSMTVDNPTEQPRTFCDYHTPFEAIRNDIFDVRDSSDASVPYAGVMAKRSPPRADNYLVVKPRDSREAEIDLLEGYKLAAGMYTVRYKATDISGLGESNTISIEVTE
jgi:hypothetical protein